MDDSGSSSDGWRTFLALVGLFGGAVSIVVGTAQLLGATKQLEAVGSYILLGLGVLAVCVASYLGYQRLLRALWVNHRRVRRVREALDRFLEDHDGRSVNARVEIGEIYLIQRCMKASGLKPKVKDAYLLDAVPGTTDARIRLLVDKGTEHGLVAGMKFAVYRARWARELCVVSARHPGQASGSGRNRATLGSRTTAIILTVNAIWGIAPDDVRASEFDVRLVQPAPRSEISQLIATLAHEVDREWGLRDLRR